MANRVGPAVRGWCTRRSVFEFADIALPRRLHEVLIEHTMQHGFPAVLQQVQSLLVRLKLARSLEALDDLVRRLENGDLSALEMLERLLSEE